MATAIDKETIANAFFLGGDQEPAARNNIAGVPDIESPNTAIEFNLDEAKRLLNEAGWTLDGDVRAKDGVKLKLTHATSVNQLRQKIQAVLKKNLESVGFKVSLESINASVYCDSSPGNDQNSSHFYWDALMARQTSPSPRPLSLMRHWYAGPDGENIAQKENQWAGYNFLRFQNADFDALYERAGTETETAKQIEIFIAMNDLLFNEAVSIPLVLTADKIAAAKTMNADTFGFGPFAYQYRNIANWNRNPSS